MKPGSEKLDICNQKIRDLQNDLVMTRKNAAQDIYHCNNSADPTMGTQLNYYANRITIDFHGLHLGEAIEKLRDMVIPILPVQKEVWVITGRGKHSKQQRSTLKLGLMHYIEHMEKPKKGWIQHMKHLSNPGIMIVKWIDEDE